MAQSSKRGGREHQQRGRPTDEVREYMISKILLAHSSFSERSPSGERSIPSDSWGRVDAVPVSRLISGRERARDSLRIIARVSWHE